jgi:hypothetical protein
MAVIGENRRRLFDREPLSAELEPADVIENPAFQDPATVFTARAVI